jgi:hypothetical protein
VPSVRKKRVPSEIERVLIGYLKEIKVIYSSETLSDEVEHHESENDESDDDND